VKANPLFIPVLPNSHFLPMRIPELGVIWELRRT
jgi:hypothetical protein